MAKVDYFLDTLYSTEGIFDIFIENLLTFLLTFWKVWT